MFVYKWDDPEGKFNGVVKWVQNLWVGKSRRDPEYK